MKSMKLFKPENNLPLSEGIEDLIIKAAYKDSNIWEWIKLKILSAGNDEIKKLWDEYKSTAESVRTIEPEKCPENIIENLSIESFSEKPSLIRDLYTAIFVKPIFTAAAITILTAVIVTSVILKNNYEYEGYKKAEVELAERQTQYALSVIGKVFKSTKRTLVEDIIPVKVSKPINQGIETVNKLFKSEGEIK